MGTCETKGFLSLLLLWLLSKQPMTGAEVTLELEQRKGSRPSPGTVYPALKYLKDLRLVSMSSEKKYALTAKGRKELREQLSSFFQTFSDIEEMRSRCGRGTC